MLVALGLAAATGLFIYWLLNQPAAPAEEKLALIRNLALRPPRTRRKKVNSLETSLLRFPLTRMWKTSDFYLLQIICAIGVTLAYVAPGYVVHGMDPDWLGAALIGLIAFELPYVLLLLALKRRHDLLGRAVHDLLSHLVLQMSAHKNTMLAFQTAPRAVREPLRAELRALLADLKLRPMQPALEAFAQRTGHPYLQDFAQAVIYQRSLSIDVEDVFKHQEELFRRNLRERARIRAQIYEGAVAGAAIFLFANLMFVWMVPMLIEATQAFQL